jgi:hypothetical protein
MSGQDSRRFSHAFDLEKVTFNASDFTRKSLLIGCHSSMTQKLAFIVQKTKKENLMDEQRRRD